MLRHRVQVESREPSLQALSWPAHNPASPFREKRPSVGKDRRRWKGESGRQEARTLQAVLEQWDWTDGGSPLWDLVWGLTSRRPEAVFAPLGGPHASTETQPQLACDLAVRVCKRSVASIVSDPLRPHGLQPARLLCPWILQSRILEWVPMLSSRGSSWPRDWTNISCIAVRFFTQWATWEALTCQSRG